MKSYELRALAASLETPDDLTPLELGQAHADIIEFLLHHAELENIVEDTCKNCGGDLRPFGSGPWCTCHENRSADTRNLRGVECAECKVGLSEWKDEYPYTECPLCGCEELHRTEWGD